GDAEHVVLRGHRPGRRRGGRGVHPRGPAPGRRGHLRGPGGADPPGRPDQLMTLDQLAPRYSDIFLLCASVGTTGVLPLTAGSAARRVLSTVPAFSIASARTGRARPFRKRFWPSSL